MEETHTPERTVPAIDQEIRGNQAAIDRMNQTRELALDCGADAVLLDQIAEYTKHRRDRIDQLTAEKADLIGRVNALPSDSVRGVMTARIIDGLTFEKSAEVCCYWLLIRRASSDFRGDRCTPIFLIGVHLYHLIGVHLSS